jgi:amidase
MSCRELLDIQLERVHRLNPVVNAVVTLDIEGAQAAAAAADERTASGADTGPLHGLPVTVKDAIETAGILSTGGAIELRHHVPSADAPSVARLKTAGSVVFGKTNVPRWSGDIQTFNELFGTTNNPWDTSKTPGGSSGGPAVAVATGMSAFELGTDIGGSVRIPSHFCGVCGHKPSWGIVSQRGYLDHVGGGLTDADVNVFGPLARRVADLELLLGVLAGPDDELAPAWQLRLPPPRPEQLAELRVGTWLDDPAAEVDSEMVAILETAARELATAGARVDGSRPPLDLATTVALFEDLLLPAISLSLPAEIGDRVSGTHRRWLERNEDRARVRRVWGEWFADHDVLLCPVLPMVAFPHDHEGTVADRSVVINGKRRSHGAALAWTGLSGVAYLPSTVIPVGRTSAGLPVGVQVVGPYLGDRTCLWVAKALERLCGGYGPPPLALG